MDKIDTMSALINTLTEENETLANKVEYLEQARGESELGLTA